MRHNGLRKVRYHSKSITLLLERCFSISTSNVDVCLHHHSSAPQMVEVGK